MHGEIAAAWQYNPFGIIFTLVFIILAGALLVPKRWKNAFLEQSRVPVYVFSVVIALIFLMLIHGIVRAVLVKADVSYYHFWSEGALPPALQDTHELTPMHYLLFNGEEDDSQFNEKTDAHE